MEVTETAGGSLVHRYRTTTAAIIHRCLGTTETRTFSTVISATFAAIECLYLLRSTGDDGKTTKVTRRAPTAANAPQRTYAVTSTARQVHRSRRGRRPRRCIVPSQRKNVARVRIYDRRVNVWSVLRYIRERGPIACSGPHFFLFWKNRHECTYFYITHNRRV